MATAIEFDHVSKQYRLGLVSTKTLSHDIRRWWLTSVRGKEDPYLKIGETNDRATKGSSDYVWALRDIDFKVEQGDVVGIIGKNGAGKSTLLKLLSRVTGPTTGTIRAHGRIGSLLEVGTGFHGEMTGRENIFMNGAILGMTRNEIQAKLDEIIDFSGCERYIDTPVKRYSSGMTVRLGFAVAAFLEPEILVVDEVLAVGDAEFQKKAIGKMKDVSQGQGRTVLFVSHNMTSVRNLCTSGILLENGMISYRGTAEETIEKYLAINSDELNNPLKYRTDRWGNGRVHFTNVIFKNINGVEVKDVFAGQYLKCEVHFDVNAEDVDPSTLIFSFCIKDSFCNTVVEWISDEIAHTFDHFKDGYISIEIPAFNFRPNLYYIALQISERTTSEKDFCDKILTAAQLNVLSDAAFSKGMTLKEGRGYSAIVPAIFD